jgi:hypothetical protein
MCVTVNVLDNVSLEPQSTVRSLTLSGGHQF